MRTKRGAYSSVKEFVLAATGETEDFLLNPTADSHIENLKEAVTLVKACLEQGMPISIMADYDADGITSAAILKYLFNALGKRVYVRFPRRFSEGYGLSDAVVDEIRTGLLICVDNGIAAVEQIKKAKEKGITVVILDHHIGGEVLPPADVIVDPNAVPGSDFSGFCGAGLSYRFACEMTNDQKLLDMLCVYAAIGTVADVVPLIRDNRAIVKKGLALMNEGKMPLPIDALLTKMGVEHIDEETIGFKIAPCLNAPGRLRDDGALEAYNFLTTLDPLAAAEKAIATNEQRKEIVSSAIDTVNRIIAEEGRHNDLPLIVYSPALPEGVIGIIAGKKAEEKNVPAFIFTDAEDGNLKGSGRSIPEVHLKNLLDKIEEACPECLVRYGGHAGAAGLTVKAGCIDMFRDAAKNALKDMEIEKSEQFYDLDLDLTELDSVMNELDKYAPYGEGCPKPVFYVEEYSLTPKGGSFYQVVGEKHVRLFGLVNAIGFDMAKKYLEDMKTPIKLSVYGTLKRNHFAGTVSNQMELVEMDSIKASKSDLELLLEAALKNF